MKRVVVVIMLALCIAGCRNNQKKEYYQSDLKEDTVPNKDVDWIGLYIRCHELDSLKNLAEVGARQQGHPYEALPDSVGTIWSNMLNEILLRRGSVAFGMYDSHREDIAKYLRLDFINYGFITKVYLPYKATQSTREEYGEICIKELENEMAKAQMGLMYGGPVPSHYENLLNDLFLAYVNYEHNDKALDLCEEILAYMSNRYGEESREYANMLNNKANLCNNTGSAYSAAVAARRAISIYDKLIADPATEADTRAKLKEEKEKLEGKLQLWQGK
ncbi:MAG: hypothetical protein II963_08325 [Bacteroidales bacterium]|nr:hypothetical protein [Bacteroidales bacterium]MBQ6082286.1 hypothetical protein [Bacteroidales bacterium]